MASTGIFFIAGAGGVALQPESSEGIGAVIRPQPQIKGGRRMGISDDSPSSASTDQRESILLGVNELTLLDLLQARDPSILEAVERLLSEREGKRSDVLLGWQSRMDQGPRSSH